MSYGGVQISYWWVMIVMVGFERDLIARIVVDKFR